MKLLYVFLAAGALVVFISCQRALSFIFEQPRVIIFKFTPKKVLFDGEPQVLELGYGMSFPPGNSTHVLEYVKPDDTIVKVQLISSSSDDEDRHLEVRLDGITGLPHHKLLSVSKP